MVIATFILAMIVLLDRILLSVAKDPVGKDLGLNDVQMGWAMSLFALGYALFQAPAGLMADRFGARRILTLVVGIWSVFTMLTGAVFNFIQLLIVRFLFGAGEAGAFPSMARAIYKWIPIGERGIVNGINFSGGRIGSALALPAVTWLLDIVGWRLTFLILGSIGILWGVLWFLWFRDDPKDHGPMGKKELDLIKATVDQENNDGKKMVGINISKMFKSSNMWLLMGQYFASNFTFFFCLTWLFPHLKNTYGLDNMEAGLYSSIPLLCGAVGNWTSGFLVDRIYRKSGLEPSRKIPAKIGFVLSAIGILGSTLATNVNVAAIFLSLSVFGADMTLSPSWSVCVDIGKRYSGTISGTMNMAGNLGSFLTALAFPYLLHITGTATPFFFVAAFFNITAMALWFFIKPRNAMVLN